jgi:hypothetical protein
VYIYSLSGEYLGCGMLHDRTTTPPLGPQPVQAKPKHSFIDLLVREHQNMLAQQSGGIDYRKVVQRRPWPFYEFAKTVAQMMGRKAGLADLSTQELESLKRVYNQSLSINRNMLKEAFENARHPNVPHIVAELKHLIHKEANHVS